MSNRDLSLALRLYTDSARFVAGLTQAESGVRRFGSTARREFDALKGAMGSVRGQLAQLGVTVGALATLTQSARMDKSLIQIGQTAAGSQADVENLRRELFRMAGDTGQAVDDLQIGFNNAVQSGLRFKEALPVIDATNKAVAVTNASAERLTSGLTVAGQAFNFDLAQPGMALLLLDKMTVAGRQGKAELEDLSDIFARVGVNASSAGFGFDSTLAFIEGLSKIEHQPEKLATLVDSTMRLFTNQTYRDAAQKATGVKFNDANGKHRDPIAVLKEIKTKYDQLKTDTQRDLAINMAFGKADQDTVKGMRTLLGTDILGQIGGEFSSAIKNAGGTLERDLPGAIDNAVDQTGRLKVALRSAADEFVRPINETFTNLVKWGLDKKENGGLGLNGNDMIGGGAALALGTFAAARYGGKAIGGLAKHFGGTAAGVAEGKVLEAAAGVTPVFVVNWPASIGGSVADIAGAAGAGSALGNAGKLAKNAKSLAVLAGGIPLSTWGSMGAAGLGTAAAGLTAAGAVGYGAGSLFNWGGEKLAKGTRFEGVGTDVIGGAIARVLATFGNEEAKRSIALNEQIKQTEIGGRVAIDVNIDGRPPSVIAQSQNVNIPFDVNVGYNMVGL